MGRSFISRRQLNVERLLDNRGGCWVQQLLLTCLGQEPALHLLGDVVVLVARLRAAERLAAALVLSLTLLPLSFNFIRGSVATRPNLAYISLHHKVDTRVLSVLSGQQSDLVTSVGLKAGYS